MTRVLRNEKVMYLPDSYALAQVVNSRDSEYYMERGEDVSNGELKKEMGIGKGADRLPRPPANVPGKTLF